MTTSSERFGFDTTMSPTRIQLGGPERYVQQIAEKITAYNNAIEKGHHTAQVLASRSNNGQFIG